MADTQVQKPAPAGSKLAMSRALGAAFLNHQVEQLEKTVSRNGNASGNWRTRKQGGFNADVQGSTGRNSAKRQPLPPHTPGVKIIRRKEKGGDDGRGGMKEELESRSSAESARVAMDKQSEKDADIVVVDASVLVNALNQIKKWCRDGRQEIVIVPLEALNALDLLKKGNSAVAQRARGASRILESQVGTNPRIRVQQDDAFVPWEDITISESVGSEAAPDWVRRTISCARWEVVSPSVESQKDAKADVKKDPNEVKVVFAILATPPTVEEALDTTRTVPTPVVPPAALHVHVSKYEARVDGVLISTWAKRAGIPVMPILPSATPSGPRGVSSDEERPRRARGGRRTSNGTSNRGTYGPGGKGVTGNGGALVERPPAVMAMMEMVSQPQKVVRLLARGEKLDPDT